MLRKNILLVVLLFVLVFITNTVSASEPIEIRMATETKLDLEHPHPSAPSTLAFVQFMEASGRFKVKVYPAAQLGDTRSVYEQVKDGQVHIHTDAEPGTVGSVDYPPLQVFSLPWLFPNEALAIKTLGTQRANDFIKDLADDMAERVGVRILNVLPTGYRHLTNSVREITKPEDLKGLKIRVMPIPMHEMLWRTLGADPTPISWTEVYTALETGVVDGQENPYMNIADIYLNEVQDYLTTTAHIVITAVTMINEEFYQSLSPEDRQILLEGMELFTTTYLGTGVYSNSYNREMLAEDMQIYDLSPEEREAFREVSQEPVLEYLRDELGEDVVWLDRLLALIDSHVGDFWYK